MRRHLLGLPLGIAKPSRPGGLGCRVAIAAVLLVRPWPVWSEDASPTSAPGPVTREGIVADVVADWPLVSNPCALAFDADGRLFVGMGPQYRNPTPDTPGDSVFLLHDDDADGVFDRRTEYAGGFNCIQGLAWRGADLWVANAPDLTVVRDLDGDGSADEYVRVYTDLGNLEHGIHGLEWAPDGRLYFSKGNSKGLTQPPDRVAPKPFRDLWGVEAPPGTPDHPEPQVFPRGEYRRAYHDPADDWGQSGGFLRCRDLGRALEVVARGMRNPWSIAHDDAFNWLGTDNDQTHGDKFVAPFFGADFGWGHRWSHDWEGTGHLPSVPASGPLFEGSGTGVAYYCDGALGPDLDGVFLVNDWLRRLTLIYRPAWDGARMVPAGGDCEVLASADGGRSMQGSSGRLYDPTDIKVGADGSVFVASWGREYGVVWRYGEQANAGRIYRLRSRPATGREAATPGEASPDEAALERSIRMLGSSLGARRIAARESLAAIGAGAVSALMNAARDSDGRFTRRIRTWATWTLGAIEPEPGSRVHAEITAFLEEGALRPASTDDDLERRIQCLRVLADRAGMVRGTNDAELPDIFHAALRDENPRVRHAALVAVRETRDTALLDSVVEAAAVEEDPVCRFAAWGALRDLADPAMLEALLGHEMPRVRLSAMLALADRGEIDAARVVTLGRDRDSEVSSWAARWLTETGAGDLVASPAGSAEAGKGSSASPASVARIEVGSGHAYQWVSGGLVEGAPAYTDRPYRLRSVPSSLRGLDVIRCPNEDAGSGGSRWLRFELLAEATLYVAHDPRIGGLPAWASDGSWMPTGEIIRTDEAGFRVYRRDFPAGEVVLGGNADDGTDRGKSNYLLAVAPRLIVPPADTTRIDDVTALLPEGSGDPERGRLLFLAEGGAGCFRCHRMEGRGNLYAPDLGGIGSRTDATFLVRSMLEPSAEITEGFAMQLLRLRGGGVSAGIMVEETGAAVMLAQADGTVVTVPRGEIVGRETLPVSGMPDIYAGMLSPQQVADIAAYLVQSQPADDARSGERPEGAAAAAPTTTLRIHESPSGAIELAAGGIVVATYVPGHPPMRRPAWINVRTPGGVPVTRPFPVTPESSRGGDDHAWMHPGIWMSFGWLDGHDYWRLKAEVEQVGFLERPWAEGRDAGFSVENRWLAEPEAGGGRRTVVTERVAYRWRWIEGGLVLHCDHTFIAPADRGFAFGDQEEGGLGVRVAPDLRVAGGNGRILADHGGRDGGGTWGRDFEWIDYAGRSDGRFVGLMVVPDEGDSRPSWAHSRDYGVLVANPFPRQPESRMEPYVRTTVAPGESHRLRYAILIHEDADEAHFDAAAAVAKVKAMLSEEMR